MKTRPQARSTHSEELVRLLEEHPGLSPLLAGEDAIAYGFAIGGWFLTLADMELLIAKPHSSWLSLLLNISLDEHVSWETSSTTGGPDTE